MTLRVAATAALAAGTTSAEVRARCLGMSGCTVDVSDRWQQARPGDVVAVLWRLVADPGDAQRWLASAEGLQHAWLTEARPQWDGLGPDDGQHPVPGLKQISFLRRAAGIDHDNFASHWSVDHGALARVHHPSFWRYTQNVVVAPLLPGTPELDGIAEITMRLRQDFVDRMYDSPDGARAVAADVATFIDLSAGWRLKTREYRT
jgi:uncharacterized protein (TIGR02118 family)